MSTEPLVSTEWLAGRIDDPTVRVVDIRGYVITRIVEPGVEEAIYQHAHNEYVSGHIPGAVYVDWTWDIVDPEESVPVQLASSERFTEAMATRGIGDSTHVVAVDHKGGQFATRMWWALRHFGHDAVSVLEGGMKRWVDEGRPIETQVRQWPRAGFRPRPRLESCVTAEQLRDQLGSPGVQILDARDIAQFTGAKRRGPRGGHIPGAISVPRERFFDDSNNHRTVGEIREIARGVGLDPARPVIAYCNGGVAATVALFNLHRAGFTKLANYDGSWNEWSGRLDLPAESGEPSERL